MYEKREAIIEFFKSGMRQAEIAKRLGIHRRTVSRTIQRFEELGTSSDRPRKGRPRSSNSSEVRKKIKLRLDRNPRRSLRKVAKDININRESVRQIVKNVFKCKPYKLQKAHLLTDKMKEVRCKRAKALQHLVANQGHERILFSDEKIFTIEQHLNPQNDRIWSPDVSTAISTARKVTRSQKPAAVMVWGGVTSHGKTPLFFVKPSVKINNEVYRKEILEDVLLPWSKRHFGNQYWIFQQDSAPSHRAKTTQDWCAENLPSFISAEEWPPYSPDLNPMDYSVWSVLEWKACSTPHKSLASLQQSLKVAWKKIDNDMLRGIVEKFPERLEAVVKAKGSYIEG